MAEMSDRERLEKLASGKEQARQESRAWEQQKQAEEASRREEGIKLDKSKTEEVMGYCKQTFQGFRLVPTRHEINVDTVGCSIIHGIEADNVEYVCLNITHWGKETDNFQGMIPLLVTRYRNGEYHIAGIGGARFRMKEFEDLKQRLIQLISDTGEDSLRVLFGIVRNLLANR